MEQDLGEPLLALSVDGGASRNDQLMQLQADLLERRVARGERAEVSAIGAAMMAAAGLKRPLPAQPSATTSFTPRMSPSERQSMRARWHDAVRRAIGTDTSTLTSKATDHRNRIKGEIA
jgi:glycerol kinase